MCPSPGIAGLLLVGVNVREQQVKLNRPLQEYG